MTKLTPLVIVLLCIMGATLTLKIRTDRKRVEQADMKSAPVITLTQTELEIMKFEKGRRRAHVSKETVNTSPTQDQTSATHSEKRK